MAKLAKVSTGTVSNVLNRPQFVAEATRERVEKAIAELGYVQRIGMTGEGEHWRRSGFATWFFEPAASGWYPPKAPYERRPVPVADQVDAAPVLADGMHVVAGEVAGRADQPRRTPERLVRDRCPEPITDQVPELCLVVQQPRQVIKPLIDHTGIRRTFEFDDHRSPVLVNAQGVDPPSVERARAELARQEAHAEHHLEVCLDKALHLRHARDEGRCHLGHNTFCVEFASNTPSAKSTWAELRSIPLTSRAAEAPSPPSDHTDNRGDSFNQNPLRQGTFEGLRPQPGHAYTKGSPVTQTGVAEETGSTVCSPSENRRLYRWTSEKIDLMLRPPESTGGTGCRPRKLETALFTPRMLMHDHATPHIPAHRETVGAPEKARKAEWFTTEEVARFLKRDPSTICRWRTARPPQGPPFVPLSQRVVMHSAHDVQQWLAGCRIDPARAA
ncbi:LacI family DNA-binding transcriptional regulator [Streptomyces mobaraensis]|uniref:LacI family DNA-binding transcriptional regulator n=1 Tax=Streptomyces mobaraensis TaxID=35621 RepID=UPI003330D86B